MELIPLVQPGRQVIERYGRSGFRVSGTVYLGPVLVFPDRTLVWADAAVTEAGLAPVVEHGGGELLLLRLGRPIAPLPAALRAAPQAHGIAVEAVANRAPRPPFH